MLSPFVEIAASQHDTRQEITGLRFYHRKSGAGTEESDKCLAAGLGLPGGGAQALQPPRFRPELR
jgi:hypothetical protein